MLIGITGYAQSGKDTVGNLLKNMLNINSVKNILDKHSLTIATSISLHTMLHSAGTWEIAKFATPLKQVVHDLFNLLPNIDKNYKYNDSHTVRELYQIVGTDIARKINPDVFIRKLLVNLDWNKHYIITDVRFPNEVAAIRERGGIIIKKESSKTPKILHESESYIDSIEADYTIPWIDTDNIFKVFEFEEKLINYLEENILTKVNKFNYERI